MFSYGGFWSMMVLGNAMPTEAGQPGIPHASNAITAEQERRVNA